MKTDTLTWTPTAGWSPALASAPASADLILYFGSTALLGQTTGALSELLDRYPGAICAGCSRAGLFRVAALKRSDNVVPWLSRAVP